MTTPRVLITGASGNIGTALLRTLRSAAVDVVGLSRRPPVAEPPFDGVPWIGLDLAEPDAGTRLENHLDGIDSVVHLAWRIQPSHDRELLRRTNQEGTRALVRAVRARKVPHLVHVSSIGAYGPQSGAADFVAETWPTTGIPTSSYSVDKVAAERIVDDLEDEPATLVTRVRPSLVLQPDAAAEIARYFLGRLVPRTVLRPAIVRLLPWPTNLRLQFVHAGDVAAAIAAILDRKVGGAFNIASSPVIDRYEFSRIFDGVGPAAPADLLRQLLNVTWRARLQPTGPGWFDMGMRVPLLDSRRARELLDWQPEHASDVLLADFVEALSDRRGGPGPLLRPHALVPLRKDFR